MATRNVVVSRHQVIQRARCGAAIVHAASRCQILSRTDYSHTGGPMNNKLHLITGTERFGLGSVADRPTDWPSRVTALYIVPTASGVGLITGSRPILYVVNYGPCSRRPCVTRRRWTSLLWRHRAPVGSQRGLFALVMVDTLHTSTYPFDRIYCHCFMSWNP